MTARLFLAHLITRRVPIAVLALCGCAAFLRVALALRWGTGQQLPIVAESAAGAVIAVTSYGPFGEAERVAGSRLAWLRLGAGLLLCAIAVALLGLATIGLHSSGGSILRDVAGSAGLGLGCAVVLGGQLAWSAPVAYLVAAEFAASAVWSSPWAWPARPAGDLGAALCAAAVFAAGLTAFAARGARERLND